MSLFRRFCKWLSIAFVGCALPAGASGFDHLQTPVRIEDARHLLMRTGLGAAPADIASLRGLTRAQAIQLIVQDISTQPHIPMPDWVEQPVPLYHARPDMDEETRTRFNDARDAELSQLRRWWVLNMLETTSPQTERMVLFWHDLFATNYRDLGKQSLAMARQNQTFRSLGFGSWEQLLQAMIRDAALLELLDSGSNHKASPNENLARELMELFVLGEGNYDESSVREAARALTGHDTSSIHDLQFRLKTWVQDRKEKTLFGQRGDFDGDDLIEILLEQEAAPRFLATRFWHAFVSDSPPDAAWLDEQARLFRQSGLNITALYTSVLQSAAFWHADNRGAIIKSPVDIVIGTARTLDYPKSQWQHMPQWLRMIGMKLFEPPNVAGWREGGGFITPGHLLNRYKVVRQMSARAARQAEQTAEQSMLAGRDLQTDESMQPDMNMQANGAMRSDANMQTGEVRQADLKTQADRQITAAQSDQFDSVELRLAAEDYQGPTRFQLGLMRGKNSLWKSSPQYFMAGRDTELYGRIQNMSDVSWQSITQNVPSEHLLDASALRVYFLNDDAGDNGDRNLYIDGVRVNGKWLPASGGLQISGCPPELRANAGKLYCNGYVELSLNIQEQATGYASAYDAGEQLLASAVHLGWGGYNEKNGKHTLGIFLDHLQTPSRRYHHLRFTLDKYVDQPITLQLDSFSCWPDCVEQWPECAWTDEHFKAARTVSFPWVLKRSDWWNERPDQRCHYQSLSYDEQMLVASLWANLPQLLEQVSKTPRVRKSLKHVLPIINYMRDEYHKGPATLADTPFTATTLPISIAAEHAPPAPIVQSLPTPQADVLTLEQLVAALEQQQMQVHQLLLPKVAAAGAPARPRQGQRNQKRYLKSVFENPLFQLK